MKRSLLLCPLLWIATVAATSATASAPAVDLSTPRSALVSLYSAMRNGDLPAVHACLLFDTAQESELFDLNFAQLAAPLRLQRALEQHFGPSSAKPFVDLSLEKNIDDSLAKVKTADIEVTGDSAILDEKKMTTDPNAENELSGVTLRQENGKWHVVASTLSDSGGQVSPQELTLIRNMSHTLSAACERTLARLAKNEFDSPAAAYAAYQSELQSAAKK